MSRISSLFTALIGYVNLKTYAKICTLPPPVHSKLKNYCNLNFWNLPLSVIMPSEGGQYLFRETEFEDDNFHPAAFVAKYRRVTSLESLRDQLRQYCNTLKDQV